MDEKKLVEKFEWARKEILRPIGVSHWVRNFVSREVYPNNSTRVERVGYTDFAKRLAKVQLAGENLSMFRAQEKLYDFTGEADFNKVDWNSVAVRQLGFGLSEYSEYVRAIAERQQELRARLETKAKQQRAVNSDSSNKPPEAKPQDGVPPSGGRGGAQAAGGGDSAPERVK